MNSFKSDETSRYIRVGSSAMKKLVRLFKKKSPLDLNSDGTDRSTVQVTTQLPPLVLKKIFLYFTERDSLKPLKLSSTPPWVLGQVCRQWRDIALAIPDLWSYLPPVFLGASRKHDVSRIFACLSELLHRCSGIPISFFLHHETADPLEYPIIDLLVAHCGQWENISLEVSGTTIRHFVKIEGQLNSLHSLEFSLCGRGEPIVKLFESAPKLRSVRVDNLASCGMLKLPWTQLTNYEDTTAFGDGVYKAFHPNSNLQHLKFSPIFDEVLDFLPPIKWTPLLIPYLTTLSIEFWTSRYKIRGLFDNLTLPALHTLVLKFSKYDRDEVMDVELVKMITRSLCDLKHLTFHGRNSPSQQVLTVMPSLTTLNINDPDQKLIQKLSQFQGDEWTLVPCLRSLTIHLSTGKSTPSSNSPYRYFRTLSRLAGIRCDTVTAFRDDQPSLPMLKTLKVAVHGIDSEKGYLSHFYYASLEPPTTEMELQSANRIAAIYAEMKYQGYSTQAGDLNKFHTYASMTRKNPNYRTGPGPFERIFGFKSGIFSRLGPVATDIRSEESLWRQWRVVSYIKNFLESDPQAAAGIYLSGIDYPLYREFKQQFHQYFPLLRLDSSFFWYEVAQWRSKLTTIVQVLKWDWDDDGYLVYIPYEDRQLPRATPLFKSQRLAYQDILPDELPAARSFGNLKLEESFKESLDPDAIDAITQPGRE